MPNLTMTNDVAILTRARWTINGPRTLILKCLIKDGSDVLARIERLEDNRWRWHAIPPVGRVRSGMADTRVAAMRAARKALRNG